MSVADMVRRRPILVTGAHRSGTTWVGRMIASAPGVRYIHEPLNPDAYDPGICALKFKHEFPYVCCENETPYVEGLLNCLAFRYGLAQALGDAQTHRQKLRAARRAARFTWSRWRGHRALLKDPHALFSAAWLADTFAMDVILLARHPAAFVGSLKNAHWAFRFGQFLEQPLLMRDHLQPFASEIETQARRPGDLIDQGILLWRLLHTTVLRYRKEHPDWIHVRHEDLSRDPAHGFRILLGAVGLPYTASVERRIEAFSGAHNQAGEHDWSEIRRDSRANLSTWKTRLTPAEIHRVRAETADVADHLYGDEDWEQ